MSMNSERHESTGVPGRSEFLAALDACEQTSAALLLALESSPPEVATIMTRRREQIERLTAILPVEAGAGDLERLKMVLNVGQEAWLKVLAEKLSATRSLASLQRALQVAHQLEATRTPRQLGVDCTG